MSTERPSQHRYRAAETFSPDAVADALGRNAGGFGRDQQSYYGEPVLHRAHWGWEIIAYFWLGGIMGGSAILAAAADTVGREEVTALVRNGRYVAFAGSLVSGALLVKDLGRPERFIKMLRILKFGSPMSVGSWALSWFSANAGLAVAAQLARDGVLRCSLLRFVPVALVNAMLALSGGLMALYTGVLVAATAIPAWYSGRRYIPAIFVASAAGTACSLNIALLAVARGSSRTIAKLERIETLAAAAEFVLLEAYRREAGDSAKPFFSGRIGKRVGLWTQLLGVAVPLALNLRAWRRHDRSTETTPRVPFVTLVGCGLALYGGYVLRESFVLAGRLSADDPKPVLIPPENIQPKSCGGR